MGDKAVGVSDDMINMLAGQQMVRTGRAPQAAHCVLCFVVVAGVLPICRQTALKQPKNSSGRLHATTCHGLSQQSC